MAPCSQTFRDRLFAFNVPPFNILVGGIKTLRCRDSANSCHSDGYLGLKRKSLNELYNEVVTAVRETIPPLEQLRRRI